MAAELSRITGFLTKNGIDAASSELVVQGALDCIDKEIQTVTLSSCSIRSWRNSLSHISRLPPELLTAIFLEYASSWRFKGTTTFVPSWVTVSRVCRTWRHVALNCPALWTCLFFVSCRWMDELLARSKTSLLSICVDLSGVRSLEPFKALEKALRHMHRIQHLWIRCSRSNSAEFLHLLTAPAPTLRSFHLYLATIRCPGIIDKDTFAGSAPCLRELRLERCLVDLSSPVFSGLTNLDLSRMSIMAMLTMDNVARIIGQSPDLRQLRLEGSLPSVSARPVELHGVARTPLPKLENVTLIDSISSIVALLAHLEFPRSAIVHLRFTYFTGSDVTILQPFIEERFNDSFCPSQIPRSSTPLIRSLDLDYTMEQDTWSVVCGTLNPDTHQTNHQYSMDEYLNTQPLLRLEFIEREFWFMEERLEGLIALCRTLPLAHLKRLTMFESRHVDPSCGCLLTEVFGDAPELRVIKLDGSAYQLIRALFRDTIFAPALTDVELRNVQFSPCIAMTPREHAGSCVRCLRHLLVNRAQLGLTLQRMSLDACSGIRDKYARGLREVVRQLDGVVVRESRDTSVDSDTSDVEELIYQIA